MAAIQASPGAGPLGVSLWRWPFKSTSTKLPLGVASKPDIVAFRSERESLAALAVGKATMIAIESKLNAQISFHAIDTSRA